MTNYCIDKEMNIYDHDTLVRRGTKLVVGKVVRSDEGKYSYKVKPFVCVDRNSIEESICWLQYQLS